MMLLLVGGALEDDYVEAVEGSGARACIGGEDVGERRGEGGGLGACGGGERKEEHVVKVHGMFL